MGLKDLAKKKLLMQELTTVDEDESASDDDHEYSSSDASASDEPGAMAKKRKRHNAAPGFKGKLDAEGAVEKRMNPLKMWAKKSGGYSTDSDS